MDCHSQKMEEHEKAKWKKILDALNKGNMGQLQDLCGDCNQK